MTAPTEAEIRESILEGLGDGSMSADDFAGLIDAFRPILDSDMARVRAGWDPDFHPYEDHPGTLWADLTRDEVDELQGAMHYVLHRVTREATQALVEGCIAAAVAFAEAHPDVPRGRWQPHQEAVPS